jgi:hypothetical protein
MSVTFRKFSRTASAMALVTFVDGRTAYLWLDGAARTDDLLLMSIARDQQAAGTIPDGDIRTVRRVR